MQELFRTDYPGVTNGENSAIHVVSTKNLHRRWLGVVATYNKAEMILCTNKSSSYPTRLK